VEVSTWPQPPSVAHWNLNMTKNAHVTLAGDRAGDYLVEEEFADGRLVLRPEPAYPAVIPARNGRAATPEERDQILGALPTDGEG
jgi:hypothetical protein